MLGNMIVVTLTQVFCSVSLNMVAVHPLYAINNSDASVESKQRTSSTRSLGTAKCAAEYPIANTNPANAQSE